MDLRTLQVGVLKILAAGRVGLECSVQGSPCVLELTGSVVGDSKPVISDTKKRLSRNGAAQRRNGPIQISAFEVGPAQISPSDFRSRVEDIFGDRTQDRDRFLVPALVHEDNSEGVLRFEVLASGFDRLPCEVLRFFEAAFVDSAELAEVEIEKADQVSCFRIVRIELCGSERVLESFAGLVLAPPEIGSEIELAFAHSDWIPGGFGLEERAPAEQQHSSEQKRSDTREAVTRMATGGIHGSTVLPRAS